MEIKNKCYLKECKKESEFKVEELITTESMFSEYNKHKDCCGYHIEVAINDFMQEFKVDDIQVLVSTI